MGCANYFKFHPDATVHDYMKRFKVDSYKKAVDEIKSLGLDSDTETKILMNTHPDMIHQSDGYNLLNPVSENTVNKKVEKYDNSEQDIEADNKIHGLYVNKIQKILNKIYDDSDMDENKREDLIDALYGQLKELTFYKESKNKSENDESEEEITTEEKLNRIKKIVEDIKKSDKILMELPEFADSTIFESQLIDLEQFDFLKEK